MFPHGFSALFAVASALVGGSAAEGQSMRAQFDHLVVGVRSLAEGVRQFEDLTGVTPTVGGKHPGRGTENALVSLGAGRYLEILAPQPDAKLSPADEPMRQVSKLTVLTWAVGVSDVEAARQKLASIGIDTTEPRPGARVTPSGARLEWSTFTVPKSEGSTMPFFIRWSDGSAHPSMTSPTGCTLKALSIDGRASDDLSRLLQALGVADVVVESGAASIQASLTCASGEVLLGSRS